MRATLIAFCFGLANLGLGVALAWWRLRNMSPPPAAEPVAAEPVAAPHEPIATAAPPVEAPPVPTVESPVPAVVAVDPPAEVAMGVPGDASVVAAVDEPEPPEELTVQTPVNLAEELPAAWFEILKDVEHCQSFVEASAQVLRLEVGRYRAALVAIDDRVRASRPTATANDLAMLLRDLKLLNLDWLQRQVEAAGVLVDRNTQSGKLAEVAASMEQVLLHQAAQIETTCSNLDYLDFTSDVDAGARRLIFEISKLLELAHGLRDRMQEALLAILAEEGRLGTVDKPLQTDPLTGLPNRCGLESVLFRWWQDDPGRKRLASIGLFDVDRMGRINEQHGVAAADRLFAALVQLLQSCLRKNRGYDILTRFDGQRLAVFAGDTGPQNAAAFVERLRRTVERSTFDYAGEPLELTLTCAVTEVLPGDTSEILWTRAEQALKHAKRVARNGISLDKGDGPQRIDPPEIDVKGKMIHVDPTTPLEPIVATAEPALPVA